MYVHTYTARIFIIYRAYSHTYYFLHISFSVLPIIYLLNLIILEFKFLEVLPLIAVYLPCLLKSLLIHSSVQELSYNLELIYFSPTPQKNNDILYVLFNIPVPEAAKIL